MCAVPNMGICSSLTSCLLLLLLLLTRCICDRFFNNAPYFWTTPWVHRYGILRQPHVLIVRVLEREGLLVFNS